MNTLLLVVAIGAALVTGFALGALTRPFLWPKSVDPLGFSAYMNRVVNLEEAETRRNENRRMLHDVKRRTMRVDGGVPAKVHKMRRRRRMYRDPSA